MGARRRGRVVAFQTLYRFDITGEDVQSLLDFSWMDQAAQRVLSPEARDFAALLIQGTLEKLPEIDSVIRRHLEHWDFSRLGRVDLAILRVSAYALLCQPGIPPSVTMDEAVEIAREYGSEDSYRFVNGVLDAIHHSREAEAASGGTAERAAGTQEPGAEPGRGS
jgi:N utilization substance protein B